MGDLDRSHVQTATALDHSVWSAEAQRAMAPNSVSFLNGEGCQCSSVVKNKLYYKPPTETCLHILLI